MEFNPQRKMQIQHKKENTNYNNNGQKLQHAAHTIAQTQKESTKQKATQNTQNKNNKNPEK